MYISVKQTAKKFGISVRRVQILCEQGRIKNAMMVSGVWLIPKNSTKPKDARKLKQNINHIINKEDGKISFDDVCKIFSISNATAKNWIRLGKLKTLDDGISFDIRYINSLYNNIKTNNDNSLKSRRNKKLITGKTLYDDYIKNFNNIKVVEQILKMDINISDYERNIIIANFAIQLYYQKNNIIFTTNNLITQLLCNDKKSDIFYMLIYDFLSLDKIQSKSLDKIKDILELKVSFQKEEDTLGFIYLSLRDMQQRKVTGAYYTPKCIIDSLIDNLTNYNNESTFCDPCCGTGNFLIGLINKGVEAKKIFGQDIDEVCIKILRLNIYILNNNISLDELYSNFKCCNSLEKSFNKKYDFILGNPPWGYDFSKKEINSLMPFYSTVKRKGTESYDVFLEKSLTMVNKNGVVAFVLPQSILSVASHCEARKILIENTSFKFVVFLDNAFSGVQCPCIILGVKLDGLSKVIGCKVISKYDEFIIKQHRLFDESFLMFDCSDEEYKCLVKINSITNPAYLKDNATFGLGIVTGNNKKYIVNNNKEGYEQILKGSDIEKYKIKQANNFIEFAPEKFQQVAPKEIYKANEKILYRFISKVPVFAYDDCQRLSLNSCNVVIPNIDGLDIKYVLAVLNSSVAAFYFIKTFGSIKLLKSHIQQLPIPIVDKKIQNSIIDKVDSILLSSCQDDKKMIQNIDNDIMDLYMIDNYEREIIFSAIEKIK